MNEDLRRLFPIVNDWTYLNHASCSPPPTVAIAALNRQLADVQMNGTLNYRNWVAARENCRKLVAKLLNARANQIAFLRNTSDALSTVANGVEWKAGDNIVLFQKDFPSNILPWRSVRDRFGVELKLCPERDGRIDLDEFCGLIDDNTKLVAVSAVQYASGFRAGLRKIANAARRVDALFVVDVIQAMGANLLDAETDLFDAAAGAFHKWMLAPEGIGFLYLSNRARARIEPTLVGWTSVQRHENFNDFEQDFKSGALAWETGTFASSLFYALEECLTIFDRIGVANINRYLLELTDYLCENLNQTKFKIISSRLANEKSSIVCLESKTNLSADLLAKKLLGEKIMVIARNNRLRISPHFYNNRADIRKLLDALHKF